MNRDTSGKSAREQRLASALRDNLRRRKSARRPEQEPESADAPGPGDASGRHSPANARGDREGG
jgi:hypothetical protein